jgi:integrase
MAKTRTSGIKLEKDGSRIIDKKVRGERIFIRLGKVSQEDAEQKLREEINRRQSAKLHRSDNRRLFCDGAAHYLIESKGKRTSDLLAYHIKLLLPFIGTLELSQVHDATLEEFKESRYEEGVSPTTINRTLEVVRTVLNRAARAWRDEDGSPWLMTAPPLITMEDEDRRPPHPLSWEEQDKLLPEQPVHLQTMTLFGINCGARDENICGLRWEWEVPVPEVKRSVFIIPANKYKTKVKHVLILNDAACSIIEQQRTIKDAAMDATDSDDIKKYVFTYDGHRVDTLNNSAWDKARIRAAMNLYKEGHKEIPPELLEKGQRGTLITDALKAYMIDAMPGFANLRVHDLRHTYSGRLRLAGVTQEDRNSLMGHKSASIPEHYASADIGRLIKLANLVLDRQGTRTLLRVVNG